MEGKPEKEKSDKSRRSYIKNCWIIEFEIRIRNREFHLKRPGVNPIEPYKKVMKEIRRQLKECKELLLKYQCIDLDKLTKEDKELLSRAPGSTRLSRTEENKIERETDIKEQRGKDLINAFNWHQYFLSPERQFEFLDEEYFFDKKYEENQKRLKIRREEYKMEQEKKRKKQKEDSGAIQFDEIAKINRMLGQVEGALKMAKSKQCKCYDLSNLLRSISTVARRIAFFDLARHMKECLTETDFEEQGYCNKAMGKLQDELKALKAISPKEFDMSEELLFELERVSEDELEPKVSEEEAEEEANAAI